MPIPDALTQFSPLEFGVLGLVTLATATDLAWRRIPNVLILAGLGLAATLQLSAASGFPWAMLQGLSTGFLMFLPLYMLRGMAAGDVKLMAAVGAFSGPTLAFHICCLTWLIGGVMALVTALWMGRLRTALNNTVFMVTPALLRVPGMPLQHLAQGASVGGLPYGVAIALATAGLVMSRHL
jgi:prepilin peptidase CpaA